MENKSQTLDQTLNKTDLGHYVAHHKNSLLVAFVVLLMGVLGFSYYRSHQEEALNQTLNDIYKFNQTVTDVLVANKLSNEEALKAYEALAPKILKSPAIMATAMEMATKFRNDSNYELAIKVLAPVLSNFSTSNYGYYLVATNLSVLYEESGDIENATKTLETLTKAKLKLLEAKTYFDLGRLYKMKNDVNNARLNFNYVVTNFSTDDYAKLAKLYLLEMGN